MTLPLKADPKIIAAHLETLVNRIGVRVAGSDEEKAAGQYVAQEFHRFGAVPEMETFPVRRRYVESEKIEVWTGKQKAMFPCSLLGASPVPEKTGAVPMVFFYPDVDYQRRDLSFLRGKAVVHVGTHIKNRENYKRLIKAAPAFVVFTDVRYPGVTPTSDGLFPAYVQDIGAVPSVSAAYFDVWNWVKDGADAARLNIKGQVIPENSLNVIGDIPGTDPQSGIIYTGGHLDSQAATPGADDNATGLAFQLELARLLSPLKLKRTVRNISFGAEEQLSVGSASYVRKHRAEVEKHGKFMFNADSCGSLLGWTVVNFNGPANVSTLLDAELHQVDLYAEYTNETIPYTDQFPFAICGVPGLWLSRKNCTSGHWYHHRPENDLSVVSPEVIAVYADAAASFIAKLANAERFPIARRIPPAQDQELQQCWKDLFGG